MGKKTKMKDTKEQLIELQIKYALLEEFVKQELGLNPEEKTCVSPVQYCEGCACGKKERLEKR